MKVHASLKSASRRTLEAALRLARRRSISANQKARIDIWTFARRILKAMPRYVGFDDELPPTWLSTNDLEEGEEAVGVYQNEVGARRNALVVTSAGLRWLDGDEPRLVRFRNVRRAGPLVNDHEKSATDTLRIEFGRRQRREFARTRAPSRLRRRLRVRSIRLARCRAPVID